MTWWRDTWRKNGKVDVNKISTPTFIHKRAVAWGGSGRKLLFCE